ncbi:disulfide isomerase/thiol-disulfide oxidase [Burkholderia sp. SJ98]|nr:disulfide isomerase/thiol-disulfide oxidase [Burkholderia sp. SJ98]
MYRLSEDVGIVRRNECVAAWRLVARAALLGSMSLMVSSVFAGEQSGFPRFDRTPSAASAPATTFRVRALPVVYTPQSSQDLRKVSTRADASNGMWALLEHASWVEDGKSSAPKIVYVFTDPNCPFCSKFWAEARPWVDAGRVQLRHVLVGILTPSSPGKAAALLAAHDPSSALHDYEARQTRTIDAQMAAGHPRPLEDASLKPLNPIPADINQKLSANAALMQGMSMQATPAFVWRGESGDMHARVGLPPDQLDTVLGPKPN